MVEFDDASAGADISAPSSALIDCVSSLFKGSNGIGWSSRSFLFNCDATLVRIETNRRRTLYSIGKELSFVRCWAHEFH